MPRSRRPKSSPAKPKQRQKPRKPRPPQPQKPPRKKRLPATTQAQRKPNPLLQLLRRSLHKATKVVVLGIGNELRGDDAAGVLVARALLKKRRTLVVIEGGSAPENFTGVIIKAKPSHVVLVDAAHMELEPGAIRIVAPQSIDGASFSTHTLPAGVIISYLKRSIECEVITIGIQPKQTEFGTTVAPEVTMAVARVAKALALFGR